MKLFITSKYTGEKVYLNLSASNREELRRKINGDFFTVNDGHTYSVYDVLAEKESNNTAAGALIGGLIGALTGGTGLVIGAGLGGLLGNNSDEEENKRVNFFNNSL